MNDHGFREAFDEAFADMDSAVSGDEAAEEVVAEEQAAPQGDEEVQEEPQADAGEQQTEEEGQEGQAAFDWSMVPDEAVRALERLPRDQTPVWYLKLKQDRDRFASEADVYRRQAEELRGKVQQQVPDEKPDSAEPASGPPPLPPQDADDETYQRMMDARESWFTEQGALKAVEMMEQRQRQQEEQRRQEAELQRQREYGQQQLDRLKQKEGFNDDVATVMAALASDQDKPWYRAMLYTETGMDRLFEEARTIVDGQRRTVQETTRKATAQSRTTPRPTPTPKQASADIEIPHDPRNIGGRVGAILDGFGG